MGTIHRIECANKLSDTLQFVEGPHTYTRIINTGAAEIYRIQQHNKASRYAVIFWDLRRNAWIGRSGNGESFSHDRLQTLKFTNTYRRIPGDLKVQ